MLRDVDLDKNRHTRDHKNLSQFAHPRAPSHIDEGENRVVLDGANDDGQGVVLGLGIAVGALEGGSVNKALIIAPLTFAILIALLLPSVLRRRRKEVPV